MVDVDLARLDELVKTLGDPTHPSADGGYFFRQVGVVVKSCVEFREPDTGQIVSDCAVTVRSLSEILLKAVNLTEEFQPVHEFITWLSLSDSTHYIGGSTLVLKHPDKNIIAGQDFREIVSLARCQGSRHL